MSFDGNYHSGHRRGAYITDCSDSQEFSGPWHGRPARELRVDAPHSNCTTSLAEVLDNQEAVAILFGPNVLDWSMMVAHGKFFDASGEK